MSDYDDLDRPSDSSEENAIIQRYSEMRAQNLDSFFDVEEFEAIIDWYMSLYDTSEASRAIENGLRQHPQSFDLRMRKSQLHLISGEGPQALAIVNALELLEPSNVDLMVLKADILTFMDHHRRATGLYRRSLPLCSGERHVDVKLSLGLLYARSGNELDAISTLLEVAEARPWDPITLEELRNAYQRADLGEEGARSMLKLTDMEPYSFQAWLQVGLLYNHLGEWRKCIDSLDMALVLVPGDETALLSQAESYYQLDMYQRAIDTYALIEEPLEMNAAICCGIAECYEQMEENEKALEFYEKCLAEEPLYTDAFLGKAIVLDHMGQTEKALGNLRIALSQNPDDYEFWHVYGEILSREGRFLESVEAFEKSLELEKEDINVYKGYIDTLYDSGDYAQALSVIEVAFMHVGNDFNIYIRAVALLTRSKSPQEAEKMLELFLREHPGKGWQLIQYDKDYLSDQHWLVRMIEEAR